MTATEAAFSYTVKTAHGDLFTIRGDDFTEFASNLVATRDDPQLADVLVQVYQKVATAGAVSVDHSQPRPAFGSGAVTPTAANQPDPFTGAPPQDQGGGGAGGNCQHGVRVAKSGEKNGKRWSGWFCPAKDRMCAPVWN